MPHDSELSWANGTIWRDSGLTASSAQGRPVSDLAATASMYSQPSPGLRQQNDQGTKLLTSLPAADEVSPPSSPDTRYPVDGSLSSHSVSPLEEMPQTRPFQTDALMAPPRPWMAAGMDGTGTSRNGDRDSVSTRWGDFMQDSTHGEPNKSGSSRAEAPSTKPAGQSSRSPPPAQVTHEEIINDPSTNETTPRGSPRESGANTPETQQFARPGESHWLANSNTQKPLPAPKPIVLPRRSSKRMSYGNAGTLHGGSPIQPHSAVLPSSLAQDDIKPTVPLKAGRNSPSRISSLPVTLPSSNYIPRSPGYDESKSNFSSFTSSSRDPSMASPRYFEGQYHGHPSRRSASTAEYSFNAAMRDMNLEGQPVSRFSATTYDTETVLDTPPRSPMSSIVSTASTPCAPSTMLNRHRHMPSLLSSNAKATSRKPLSYNAEPSPPSSASRSSMTKSLPPSPAEVQSADLISSLQAQLDDYRHQRGNLQRIIRDLQPRLAPGPHAVDRQTRENLKKTFDDYHADLDEIIRQEHDIGMRLHRAWRRREKEEFLDEPTGLWVRRVTG